MIIPKTFSGKEKVLKILLSVEWQLYNKGATGNSLVKKDVLRFVVAKGV